MGVRSCRSLLGFSLFGAGVAERRSSGDREMIGWVAWGNSSLRDVCWIGDAQDG